MRVVTWRRLGWRSAALALSMVACGGDDPVAVATVSVTPSSATVIVSETSQLAASALDATGGVITGRKVTWSTSNASAATVSAAGLVTGVTPGGVTISATVEGMVGSATITVAPPPVATVVITPTTPTVVETDTLRLRTVLTVAGGTVVTGRTVVWSSASPATATINSATGLVTGVSPGTAAITATSEGRSATAMLTVTQSLCNIALAKPIVSAVPQVGTLAATDCNFGDGTYLDLYSFTLPVQSTLDVTMKSRAFDAYLFIYKVNLTELVKVGENDDEVGVAGTDARLTGSLGAGSYLIVANGFTESATNTLLAAFGAYTVTFTSPYTAPLSAPRMLNLTPSAITFDRVAPEQARVILRGLRRQR